MLPSRICWQGGTAGWEVGAAWTPPHCSVSGWILIFIIARLLILVTERRDQLGSGGCCREGNAEGKSQAHDRKHLEIRKSKITVITLANPFLSLLLCSAFSTFQNPPEAARAVTVTGGRPGSNPAQAPLLLPLYVLFSSGQGKIALIFCLRWGICREHLPGMTLTHFVKIRHSKFSYRIKTSQPQ